MLVAALLILAAEFLLIFTIVLSTHGKVGQLMSAVSDFAAKMNAHNDKIDAAVDGLVADVKFLTDTIEKLQTNPGPISLEDQALLDSLEVRADTVASKLATLDSLTPPQAPPVE